MVPQLFSIWSFTNSPQHNPEKIESLTSRISQPSDSHEALSAGQQFLVIKALTFEIGRLDREPCNLLVSAIIKLKWYQNGQGYMEAYARFLTVLVSGIPRWYSQIATKLVSEFAYVPDASIHHSLLHRLVKLMPTSTASLPDILKSHYPHQTDSAKITMRYIQNTLQVVEYAPDIRKSTWELLFEKVVELDVGLQGELEDIDEIEIEDEELSSDEEGYDTAHSELGSPAKNKVIIAIDDSDDDQFHDEDFEISEYEIEDTSLSASEVRQKLDMILSYLLDTIDCNLALPQIESGEGPVFFLMLQTHFKTYILSTYQTRSAQYLLFKAAHADAMLMDSFLASLIETSLAPKETMETRLKAVQYVASLLARAKGISEEQIVAVISIFRTWLDQYVLEREAEVDFVSGGGMGRFRLFYSVTQALMYIFCFRHAVIRKPAPTDSTVLSDSEWHCDLDKLFRRLIITKFNPLRYCRRTVVAMFAQIAQKEGLVYCFTIMEQNRLGGGRASSSRTVPATGDGIVLWHRTADFLMLDSYFPFDPLHLPTAKEKIQNCYIEWADVADEEDSGSEEYDEEDEDDDDENDV